MPPALPLVLSLVACAQWPRYDHLPEDTAVRLPAGSEVGPTWDIEWADATAQDEPGDDDPRGLEPEAIRPGQGAELTSSLTGTGWVYGTPPERDVDCEDTSAFPPKDDGYYLSDVDWRLVDVGEVGILCSAFYADRAGAQVDVVAFEVDACGLPVAAVFPEGGSDLPLGFGVSGAENVWSFPVTQSTRYAIAAAGWAPNDAGAELPYHWAISFLAAAQSGEGAETCPPPPNAVAL